MFEDRRTYPRRKETVTFRVALSDGEITAVTTDIGPTGAFFAGARSAPVGTEIDVLVRPVGSKIAPVRLRAEVVRVVPVGSPTPPGFAVRWLWAWSEAGSEPIYHVLRKVLRIIGVTPERLAVGRKVRFDFPGVGETFNFGAVTGADGPRVGISSPPGVIREEVLGPRTRTSSTRMTPSLYRRAAPSGSAGTSHEPTPVDPPRIGGVIAGDATELDDFSEQTPPSFQAAHADDTAFSAPPDMKAVEPVVLPVDGHGVRRERSGAWSTYSRSASRSPGRRQTSDVMQAEDLRPAAGRRISEVIEAVEARRSGSGHFDPGNSANRSDVFEPPAPGQPSKGPIPVTAEGTAQVRRTSRRPNSTSHAAADLRPLADIRHMPSGGEELGRHTASGKLSAVGARRGSSGVSMGDSPFLERSQIFGRSGQLDTGIGIDVSGVHSSVHGPVEIDLPVTFEHDGRFIPGRLCSAASLAVEIECRVAPPPEMRLVLNMPVEVEGIWRTIYLHGKLLATPEERDGQMAFVVALERVQEGEFTGAYSRFLTEAQAES
ncbi:MAG: hypothetical protein RIT45_445 [Pseudomonadota bacterium]|jgi:hypothetical protein